MIPFIFAIVLLLHGLIHLAGLRNEPNKANWKGFMPATGTGEGLWLTAAVLFMVSALLLINKISGWWVIGTVALMVSQIMIFRFWKEARWGTLLNIAVMAALVIGYGKWHFNRNVNHDLKEFKINYDENSKISKEDIAQLPPVVQKWLNAVNLPGNIKTQSVYLEQKGRMRMSEDAKWMRFSARQYVRLEQPAFLWTADVSAKPWLQLAGRDHYQDGKGEMIVKALSLLTLAHGQGPSTDQGAMIRYLAEICWYPAAALQPYIKWQQTSDSTAKATMTYGGITGSGEFSFENSGEVKKFEALRYYDRKTGPTLERWTVDLPVEAYREFQGIRIPSVAEVHWRLNTGDLHWLKVEVTEVKCNEVYE